MAYRLKKLKKFFDGKTGLLNDRFQGPTLEVSVMKGNGHAKSWLIGMFENVVAARCVMNEKPGSLQSAKDFFRCERRQPPTHAASSPTVNSSFTGWSRMSLSGGI